MKHTLEQLSAMPDRELDAVVAVSLGWKFNEDVVWAHDDIRCRPGTAVHDGKNWRMLPEFSSDWSAMGEVVEKIRPRAAQIDIWARRDGTYACYIHAVDEEFWKEGDFTDDEFAEAKDAPRAASMAAVLAVEASRD